MFVYNSQVKSQRYEISPDLCCHEAPCNHNVISGLGTHAHIRIGSLPSPWTTLLREVVVPRDQSLKNTGNLILPAKGDSSNFLSRWRKTLTEIMSLCAFSSQHYKRTINQAQCKDSQQCFLSINILKNDGTAWKKLCMGIFFPLCCVAKLRENTRI